MATPAEVLESVGNLTVNELVTLTKEIETKFDVKASDTPTVMIEKPVEKVEVKTTFTVVLAKSGEEKIQTIKVVRMLLGLGLKESKDFVDGAPKVIREDTNTAEAEKIKKMFEEVGATIEIK